MLSAVVPEIGSLALIIALGYLLRKKGYIDAGTEGLMGEFALYIVIPAMLVHSILTLELDAAGDWGTLLGLTCAAHLFMLIFALVATAPFRCSPRRKRTLRVMMLFNNVVNIAYPVVGTVYGSLGILYATAFNLAFNLLLWTLGLGLLQPGGGHLPLRRFATPAMISMAAGYGLSLSPVAPPRFLLLALSKLGAMLPPLAMIIIGCALAGIDLREMLRDRGLWLFVALKQLLMPMLFFLLLRPLVEDGAAVGITTMLVAMPAAVNLVAFVGRYGGDSGYAAQIVALSTLVALPVFPVLLYIMNLF